MEEHKVRGKPEKFAEHYNQATLFWNSQTDVEKQHIIRAFRFELTKVQTAAVRERVVARLRNVAEELAQAVADGLGMTELPEPLPKVLDARAEAGSADVAARCRCFARPGEAGHQDAADRDPRRRRRRRRRRRWRCTRRWREQGAVPRFVGIKLGQVQSASGDPIEVEVSMETAPSVVWDAMIVPDGEAAADALAQSGHALEFLKDQYRHCKPILLMGAARVLVEGRHSPDPAVRRRRSGAAAVRRR